MTCAPLRASKILGMSDRELILQLEKASTTLTRLKNVNLALRKRLKELESSKNDVVSNPNSPVSTPAVKPEIQELREQLDTALKAALDNLTYAQEIKSLYEDLKASTGHSDPTLPGE